MTGERHVSDMYPVPAGWKERAIGEAAYAAMYETSLAAPDAFWLEQAQRLDWMKAPVIAGDWSFDEGDFRIEWFADGTLNVSANCIDRHLATRGDEWRSSGKAISRHDDKKITYREAARARLPLRQCPEEARREARATASPSTCR
jgi:acetyl-CoA synthetase